MKKFILKNKGFISTLLIILIFSVFYKLYKVREEKANKTIKEVVTIYLKNNEIKDGIVELVDKFNDSHEDIYIRLRLTADDYDNRIYTKLANEYDIDILEYNGRTLLDKDFIRPLSSIDLDLSQVKDGSLLYYNDEPIGVKYGVSMPKLMYNKELLNSYGIKNPPLNTLDDLIVVAEKIKGNDENIIPLNLSLSNIHDIFSVLGTASTSENTTYSTFWNYKTSEYDYAGLAKVLEKFKYMYEKGLINEDFDTKTSEELFNEFKDERAAIMPVNYYQKYSVRDRLEGMNLTFSNIPFLSDNGILYYYTYSRTLVLANNNRSSEKSGDHDKAVKYVFQWLMSEDVTNYLIDNDYNFSSFANYNIDKSDILYGMNENSLYKNNPKDPTEVLAGNSDIVRKHIFKMIKGGMDINEGVEELKEEMNKFINSNSRNQDIDLSKYKE